MPGDPVYTSADVCALTGVTYRQLDYWTRTGIVHPSITPAAGYGSRRAWSAADIEAVATIGEASRRRRMPLVDLVA